MNIRSKKANGRKDTGVEGCPECLCDNLVRDTGGVLSVSDLRGGRQDTFRSLKDGL